MVMSTTFDFVKFIGGIIEMAEKKTQPFLNKFVIEAVCVCVFFLRYLSLLNELGYLCKKKTDKQKRIGNIGNCKNANQNRQTCWREKFY